MGKDRRIRLAAALGLNQTTELTGDPAFGVPRIDPVPFIAIRVGRSIGDTDLCVDGQACDYSIACARTIPNIERSLDHLDLVIDRKTIREKRFRLTATLCFNQATELTGYPAFYAPRTDLVPRIAIRICRFTVTHISVLTVKLATTP